MGLAPSGKMRQQIYEDPYGLDAWDQRKSHRCFISLVNSTRWMAIASERSPIKPPTANDYARHGLPWFDYYGADAKVMEATKSLKSLSSVYEIGEAKREHPLPENESTSVDLNVVGIGCPPKRKPLRRGEPFSDEIYTSVK